MKAHERALGDCLDAMEATIAVAGRCGGGTAAMVADGGALDLSNFTLARSDLVGIYVAPGGEADLHLGFVDNNLIGACVRNHDFNIARLQDRVLWRENTRTLDTIALPVPQPVGEIDE